MNAQDFDRIGYTVKEVAAALGKSDGAVRQLIHRGVIPVTRIGGSVLVPASWLATQRTAAEAAASALPPSD